jgi:serine phosphatase RsbU (regulator of sigma subunit)
VPEAYQPIIYVVDDEVMVTQSIKSFLELETEYNVETFQSAQEALEAVGRRPPDFVISDFLMPEMDGLEFLRAIRRQLPDVPRVLLTGYADKENAIKGINTVGLYQYIEKPWDNDNLHLIIRNGLQNRGLQKQLEQKVRELDQAIRDRDKIAQKEERLSQELYLARQLQQRMLPSDLPQSDGLRIGAKYCPVFDIGGDFYDVIRLKDGRWAVLLADLTGHGIQAALSTSLLKFAFSGFAEKSPTPEEIVRGMNGVLQRGLPSDIFVAAVLAVVDPSSGECQIINAGSPHPVWLRRDAAEVRMVIAEGLLLGVADESYFTPGDPQTIQLTGGDRLLLYTDGITEAMAEDGRHFEDVLLLSTLNECRDMPLMQLAEELTNRAREYHRADLEPDDITVVTIEKT